MTQLTYTDRHYEATVDGKRVIVDEQTMQDTVANYQGDEEECYTAEFWIESFEDGRLDPARGIVSRA